MTPALLVAVEEYLHTSFADGDREYIDGRIVERNVGEIDHGEVQTAIAMSLRSRLGKRFWVAVEVRVQVGPARFRVPDVLLLPGPKPAGRVVVDPPFLVIEVLSRDDRAEDLQEKIDDYLAAGVRFVWVVNPRTGRGYVHTLAGSREAKDGVLRTDDPAVELSLAEVFP